MNDKISLGDIDDGNDNEVVVVVVVSSAAMAASHAKSKSRHALLAVEWMEDVGALVGYEFLHGLW